MWSSLKKNRRGSMMNGLLLISTISFISLMIGTVVTYLSKTTQKKIVATRASVQYSNAIESMLMAYRLAEFKYLQFVQACPSAQPFMAALKTGYGGDAACTPGSLTVFTGTDAGTTADLYTYGTGCTINKTGTSCPAATSPIITAKVNSYIRALASEEIHKIYLTSVLPDRMIAEFTAVSTTTNEPNIPPGKYAFAIKGSLTNAAHLEADGRVTQENPDPLAYCQGSKWATFLIFDPGSLKCLAFTQLGSGTGLAYYNEHYFGFRPTDGQVIDLLGATNGSSYMVNEDGTITGSTTTFVPYNKSWLVNMDDITVIGKQIYYVGKQGTEAEVGVLDKSSGSFVRKPLCHIGQMGWAQAYEGIAALGFSDPILPEAGDGLTDRIARFFLKTSGGDLLSLSIALPNGAPTPICSVVKDQNLQQVEYKRTYGFDRTVNAKPYVLY